MERSEPQERCPTIDHLQNYFPQALKVNPKFSPEASTSYFKEVLNHLDANNFLRTLITEEQVE